MVRIPPNPLKIAMIGPFPPPLTGHGLANLNLRDELRARSHCVQYIDTAASAKIGDISSQGRLELSRIFFVALNLLSGARMLIFQRFDVVYLTPGQTLFGYLRFLPFLILAHFRRAKVIGHFHGAFFRQMYSAQARLVRRILKLSLTLFDQVVVLSSGLMPMFEGLVDVTKIRACSNGVPAIEDCSDSLIEAKLYSFREQPLKILFLSNLLRSKGVLDLLDAVLILKLQGIPIQCELAGSLTEEIKDEVYSRLDALGDSVRYLGVVEGKEKARCLLNSSILCLPTYYPVEGQPLCILEAYGAGCAVVATNHSGIADILKEGKNGTFCEAKNPVSIAQAILRISADIPTVGKYNYKEYLSSYTLTSFVDRVEALMYDVLADSKFFKISRPTIFK